MSKSSPRRQILHRDVSNPPLRWQIGIKVTVVLITEETWLLRSNILSECFNNVDVGVPLWLTEPQDKHPRWEFVSSYPALYVPHFILAFLYAFIFIE